MLATPANHPLVAKNEAREIDLSNQCVLLLEEGHCLRDQALEVCDSDLQLRLRICSLGFETQALQLL